MALIVKIKKCESPLIYKEGDHVSGGGYWLEGVTRKVRMKLSPLSVVCRLLLSVLLRSRTTRKNGSLVLVAGE